MGVIEKLKKLHKQTLIKLGDIGRVVVADEAGVNTGKYLGAARTLDNYLNPEKGADGESTSPTISGEFSSSADAGDLFTFSVNLTAGAYDGTKVYLKITISPYDGVYLQYYDDSSSSYMSISGTSGVFNYMYEDGGFELSDTNITFRAKAETGGSYTITIAVITIDGDEQLAESTNIISIEDTAYLWNDGTTLLWNDATAVSL